MSSDFVDFHPTDVQVDADGSLLVIDTGGWYKLCCPTSQLWKPDVVGGIYRVSKIGAKTPVDPRGRTIAWNKQTPAQLWTLLGDSRAAVRQRATPRVRSSPKIHMRCKNYSQHLPSTTRRVPFGKRSMIRPLNLQITRRQLQRQHSREPGPCRRLKQGSTANCCGSCCRDNDLRQHRLPIHSD